MMPWNQVNWIITKWRAMKRLTTKWFCMKLGTPKEEELGSPNGPKPPGTANLTGAVKRAGRAKPWGMGEFWRKQQYFKVAVGIVVFIILGIIGFYAFADEAQTKPDRKYKTSLTGGSDRFSPQKAWFEQVTSKLEDITQRLSSLEGRSPLQESSTLPGATSWQSSPENRASTQIHSGHPSTSSQNLSSESKTSAHSNHPMATSSPVSESPSPIAPHHVEEAAQPSTPLTTEASLYTPSKGTPNGANGALKGPHTAGIHHVALSKPTTKTLKTGDNTIPAGAFAEGVLLGGVDASTSIQASSDPRPVLLRLTNPGTLPRRFKSDLCGCHVLAACYGDMSSERVFMRLEKITCTERKTGEIIEMNVKGYVAGEDGRAGLRGTLVDRAGESVRNAAIGGFIGGMAGFIGQANQNPVTYSLSSGLSQTPGLKGGDMLRQGAAKGAGNALEKYADFYIKRGEQMQPVIQVQAGRIVDIVTTESTPFEDSAERRSLIQINDRKRYEQVRLPPLGDTQPHSQEGDAS